MFTHSATITRPDLDLRVKTKRKDDDFFKVKFPLNSMMRDL